METAPHLTQNGIDESYAEFIQNLEIYGSSPIANAKQIIEIFETSTINIITHFLKYEITKNDLNSVKIKFKLDIGNNIANSESYTIDNIEAAKVLVWIIKKWANSVLNIMEETNCSPFLWSDCSIYRFREWFSIIGDFNRDKENEENDKNEENEENEYDIISTFKTVKDSMSNVCGRYREDCIEQWISTHVLSYPEKMCIDAGDPKLYEISIPTHHHNIKTAKLPDMPFDWDHHTVTEITMYNILKWILRNWIEKEENKIASIRCGNLRDEEDLEAFAGNSSFLRNKDYMNNRRILTKMKEWVDMLV